MSVTVAPTNTAVRIADYRAANPTVNLTMLAIVTTPPGCTATPSPILGGWFQVWYDLTNNKLLIDTTSTQT